MLQTWLDAAEVTLTVSLTTQTDEDASSPMLSPQARQEQENLLGDLIACRAFLESFKEEGGQGTLVLCQQALSLLSADNSILRAQVYWAQLRTYYISSANDAVAAIQSGLQGIILAQEAGDTVEAITIMGLTACFMIGTGQLHQAQQLAEQAMQLGMQPGGFVSSEVAWPTAFRAEILREWNELDAALSVAQEAISLCKQVESMVVLSFLLCGYAILLRISLSRGDLDTARSALQQVEHIGRGMNQSLYIHLRSLFTTVDQIRFWLASGELEQATRWAKELNLRKRQGSLFVREREEVACVRVLLATACPTSAVERLEPVLQRATVAQRWGHVIEIRQLQALAYQMCHEETQALDALSEAVRLAEPEGYMRRFVDEGAPMAALLSRLREKQRSSGPTPYLDTVLAAFPQHNKTHEQRSKRVKQRTKRSLSQD
jgi:LuxR family maltose regulon positive regulatory protein